MGDKPLMLSSMERMTVRQALEGMQEDLAESRRKGNMSLGGYDRAYDRTATILEKLNAMDE